MNLSDVMTEIGNKLETITGLRVFDYPPNSINPPTGVVTYPETIEYHATYGAPGAVGMRALGVVLVAGKADSKAARDTVSAWSKTTGNGSVKQALESASYTTLDDLTVTTCEFDVMTIGAVDYMAAIFRIDIIGQGD